MSALVHDSGAASGSINNAPSLTFTVTFGARVLVAGFHFNDTGVIPSAPRWSGDGTPQNLTQIDSQLSGGGPENRTYLYYLDNPTPEVGGTVNCASTYGCIWRIEALTLRGAAGGGPASTVKGTSATIVATVDIGGMAIGVCARRTSTPGSSGDQIMEGSGQTNDACGANVGAGIARAPYTDGSETFIWTGINEVSTIVSTFNGGGIGSQVIVMSKLRELYRDMRLGRTPGDELVRRYNELMDVFNHRGGRHELAI